jgi:putative acetyltransferase
VRIDAFQSGDLDALVELWVRSWEVVFPEIDFEARRGWFRGNLTDWTEAGKACRVVRSSLAPVGFSMVCIATGHIEQLCVAEAAKGQGIAYALMQDARTLCPDGLVLEVNTDNARAIAFYQKQGFVETGTSINPRSGLSTLTMAWSPRPRG